MTTMTNETRRRSEGADGQETTGTDQSTAFSLPKRPASRKRVAHNEPDPRIEAANIRLMDWDSRRYLVESDSVPGTFHTVKLLWRDWTCSCAAHKTCWHILGVMERYKLDLRCQTARLWAQVAEMVAPGLVSAPRPTAHGTTEAGQLQRAMVASLTPEMAVRYATFLAAEADSRQRGVAA